MSGPLTAIVLRNPMVRAGFSLQMQKAVRSPAALVALQFSITSMNFKYSSSLTSVAAAAVKNTKN